MGGNAVKDTMKIEKEKPKFVEAPQQELQHILEALAVNPSLQFPIKEWIYQKGDIFHWNTILDAWDSQMELIIQEHKFDTVQIVDFSPETVVMNMAGVDANPQSNTFAPDSLNPLINAFFIVGPEILESVPTATETSV